MRIACEKCKKLVDSIDTQQYPDEFKATITVHCHGETDSMDLPYQWMQENQDFVQMINFDMIVGVAFKEQPSQ